MQTHKRLIARILSLVITSSMVLTTLPLNVLASDELSEKTEIIQESDKENSETGGGLVSKSTDGTGGTSEGTLGLAKEGADTGNEGGTNKTDNDFNISSKDVKINAETGDCSKADPHVITGTTEANYIYVTTGTHFVELNNVNIRPTGSTALGIANGATVNLILANDSENILMTKFSAGISVPTGATLNISGDGKLEVTGAMGAAGIGGSNQNAGTITIEGGTIIATGGSNGAAGIGGGNEGASGIITINGGEVTANGGSNGAAGIGGGNNGAGGEIIINGGTITATGGPSGAGIGGGKEGEGGTITIKDGTVTAKGGAEENDTEGGGAGIGGGYNGAGGTITISGTSTKVIATGGSHTNGGGAGIGSGFNWGANESVNGGTITISGGIVTAIGGKYAAGIGGGSGANAGTITISGSNTSVTATGGSSNSEGGAGIGSGFIWRTNEIVNDGTITISGGIVTAIGGKHAAGIGGCSEKPGGTITINGGTVTSSGGESGAGIGGGYTGAGGDITITNGIITANGIYGGAGIGGGWGKSGGTIKISGSDTSVTATGGGSNSNGGAGIGDGYIKKDENGSASVSISSGVNVTAVSSRLSSAILGEITDTDTYIMQLDFLNEVAASSNIKVLNASEEKASYTSTSKFQSIAFNVPRDKYKATLGSNPLVHYNDSSSSEEFEIKDAGLTKFNKVKVNEGGSTAPVDPKPDEGDPNPEPNPTPTPPSTGGSSSNTSNNIGAEGTESGSSVQVTTTRTPDEVKDIIEDKYIIDTIEIKKAEEPVKIKIKVDKKKTKDIFVVQTNPETKKVELVAKSEVDNKGYAEFMTNSKEKLTIVTQLYVGFIDTVATVVKPSVTYYIDETQTFKKGWFKLEDKDWYFADYLSEEIQKNRWVADGEDSNKLAKWYYLGEDGVMFEGKWIANNADGTKWYYVDQNGLFLRDTVIDGYVINSEGYWSK